MGAGREEVALHAHITSNNVRNMFHRYRSLASPSPHYAQIIVCCFAGLLLPLCSMDLRGLVPKNKDFIEKMMKNLILFARIVIFSLENMKNSPKIGTANRKRWS